MLIRVRPGVLFALLAFLVSTPAPAQPLEFDLDGDGRVDRVEFAKGREARFKSLDRNRDNVITAVDFPPDARTRPLQALLGKWMEKADIDQDGKVTLDEVQLSGAPVFDEADSNLNGVLEKAELARLMAQIEGARP